jgi:NADH dehydrogenase
MTNVIVLGAGYAGLAATMQLAARGVPVTLVNEHDRFTERMRLHLVATGQPVAELSIPTLLAGTGASFVRGHVTAVDPTAKTVQVDDRTRHYDILVYALGTLGNGDGSTLDDPAPFAERLESLRHGTVVVAGSGLTGIESAAETAERFPALTVVLAGRQAPGADLNPPARAHLQAALDRRGVQVRTGVDVLGERPGAVDLAGGESIEADAVLWTTGTHAAPLASAAGFAVDDRGRIVTDAALRSVTHPSVYAVGDAAAIPQPYGVLHGTCQSGMPTGVHAALCIVRGTRPFRFGYYHTAVSLGRHDGIVQFTHPDGSPRRICLTGRLAARYKETVTASPWPTFGRMKRMPASAAWWPRGGRFTR